jgi:hypothetical protein
MASQCRQGNVTFYHVDLHNTKCATHLLLLVTFVPNIFICKGELKECNKGLLEIPAVQLRSKFVPVHAIKVY